MRKYYLIGLVTVLAWACNKNENSSPISLQQSGFISVPLDSTTSYKNMFYDVVSFDGMNYLAYTNKIDNSLRLVNLNNTNDQQKIEFDTIPELSRGSLMAFNFVNKDSIFLFGEFGAYVALYSLETGIRNVYDIRNKKDSTERLFGFARRFLDSTSKPIFKKNKIYIAGFEEYPLNDPATHFKHADLELCIDLTSETFQYLPIGWPLKYNSGTYLPIYNRTYNPTTGELIYNFLATKNLTAFNLETYALKEIKSGSSYVKNIPPADTHTNIEVYFNSSPAFQYVQYDAYSNLYFRMIDHGLKKKNENNSNWQVDRGYSIVVMDSDFRILTEYMLAKNTYDVQSFFVYHGAIYLSESNENNPELNENYLRFTKFELSTKND